MHHGGIVPGGCAYALDVLCQNTSFTAQLRTERGDGETGGLRFKHLPTPTGVEPLILDPQNAGAVFQAASQFNALEMVGPGVSPRQGIACYSNDQCTN